MAENKERKEWGMNKNQPDKSKFVKVIDFDMKFISMVTFMVKWAIASIPAFIILFLIAIMFSQYLLTLGIRF